MPGTIHGLKGVADGLNNQRIYSLKQTDASESNRQKV